MDDRKPAAGAPTIDEIYRQLKKGLGHELVDDNNVFELIRRSEQDGQAVLAQELREWKFPCKPDRPEAPARRAGHR
ncbi:MAG: hypothetical protein J0H00_22340 [Burkholderiales bacterium]|nr:hypothetical protein [Burkholderiales bacterium]OJX06922.1 MAG: hypothetical protein BGO72_09165 [Burkholderiales bacterium 70-64]